MNPVSVLTEGRSFGIRLRKNLFPKEGNQDEKNNENGALVAVSFFLFSLIWTTEPVMAQKEKKEILIGSNLPLSGPASMAGEEQRWSYEQAVEDVNKGGGIYVKEYGKKLPVRLIVMDDETDGGKAATVVERLIKRTNVDFLLGGYTAVHGTLPGLITAEKYHKYYHTSYIWIPTFLEHNFKWGTMYFFDPAVASDTIYKVWSSVPEDQRPKNRPSCWRTALMER